MDTAPAQPPPSSSPPGGPSPSVLIVLSSEKRLFAQPSATFAAETGASGGRRKSLEFLAEAGVSLSSLLSIHSILTASGLSYQLATPSGAPPALCNVDSVADLADAVRARVPPQLLAQLGKPLALRTVTLEDFAGLLLPHHLGAAIDLFNSSALGSLVAALTSAAEEKVVCSIGYGGFALAAKRPSSLRDETPSGAAAMKKKNGNSFPFANYTMTGVSPFDECRYPFFGHLPCMLQELLEGQGASFASFECTDTPGMIVDRNLVSGANEESTALCVQTLALLLCCRRHASASASQAAANLAPRLADSGDGRLAAGGARDARTLTARERLGADEESRWKTAGSVVQQFASAEKRAAQEEVSAPADADRSGEGLRGGAAPEPRPRLPVEALDPSGAFFAESRADDAAAVPPVVAGAYASGAASRAESAGFRWQEAGNAPSHSEKTRDAWGASSSSSPEESSRADSEFRSPAARRSGLETPPHAPHEASGAERERQDRSRDERPGSDWGGEASAGEAFVASSLASSRAEASSPAWKEPVERAGSNGAFARPSEAAAGEESWAGRGLRGAANASSRQGFGGLDGSVAGLFSAMAARSSGAGASSGGARVRSGELRDVFSQGEAAETAAMKARHALDAPQAQHTAAVHAAHAEIPRDGCRAFESPGANAESPFSKDLAGESNRAAAKEAATSGFSASLDRFDEPIPFAADDRVHASPAAVGEDLFAFESAFVAGGEGGAISAFGGRADTRSEAPRPNGSFAGLADPFQLFEATPSENAAPRAKEETKDLRGDAPPNFSGGFGVDSGDWTRW
ncbi:Parkinson disease 7 domain containing 1 family protein [Besnoitia besnoiti]|uniref:Parkinson disease 7 domain containing 1 family protein n=1 Tax=Besnoitia besnoiti TaxID=94643 RepID=A0A2A9MNE4_BESBE|nr:Parkinson disease 7 domain containing 1 family protein [Besnoitia besnoiti]PFH38051.1 Parkinson disease 7 domain containing 1 family protein [Besnoitia besnoiti]